MRARVIEGITIEYAPDIDGDLDESVRRREVGSLMLRNLPKGVPNFSFARRGVRGPDDDFHDRFVDIDVRGPDGDLQRALDQPSARGFRHSSRMAGNALSPMSRRDPRNPQSWKSATFSACSVSSRLRFTMCWVRALSLVASPSRPSRFST